MIPDSEIINSQLIKASAELPVTVVCRAFGISRSVFYYRKQRYEQHGLLTSRSKRPKKTVMEVAESLREGNLIKVLWLDASETGNVRLLTNRVVATYEKTEGYFLGLYGDHQYKRPHLLLCVERIDLESLTVASIPLSIVMKIMPLADKAGKKNIGSCKPGVVFMMRRKLERGIIRPLERGTLRLLLGGDVKVTP